MSDKEWRSLDQAAKKHIRVLYSSRGSYPCVCGALPNIDASWRWNGDQWEHLHKNNWVLVCAKAE